MLFDGLACDGLAVTDSRGRAIDLIAFDVDGTLVEHPDGRVIWQLLNERYHGSDEVGEARYREFAAGRLEYHRWVELDVTGWMAHGATRAELLVEVRKLRRIAGARQTLAGLRSRGYRLAVISGTLDLVLEEHFPSHPFDDVHSNKLHFDADDRLHAWEATPFDNEGKAHALQSLADRYGLPLSRCAFVGDNLNDVAAASVAGFSIALNPKAPEIEAAAHVSIRAAHLGAITEFFP